MSGLGSVWLDASRSMTARRSFPWSGARRLLDGLDVEHESDRQLLALRLIFAHATEVMLSKYVREQLAKENIGRILL